MTRYEGPACLDKRTKNLVKRLKDGEIAIIDHMDLDRVSAEALLDTKVSVVINASHFNSGRYPNAGPILLCSAGVHLIDNVGSEIFDRVTEGEVVRVEGGSVLKAGKLIATGEVLTTPAVRDRMAVAQAAIGAELEKFAVNTLDYLKRENSLVFDLDVPESKVKFTGRHALIVVRGYDYQADLQTLRSYIHDMHPVLIGVDGGADALLAERLKPDIIIGDMDSVSDEALGSGAELIVHAYLDGLAPGLKRLHEMDLPAAVFRAGGTSEDLALLLAYEKGAELIVAVGTHGHLIEFLDKGREGMASTFLTRLKVGDRLVDAKGVSQLYRSTAKISHLVVLVVAALTTISVIILKTPLIRLYLSTWLFKLKLLLGV